MCAKAPWLYDGHVHLRSSHELPLWEGGGMKYSRPNYFFSPFYFILGGMSAVAPASASPNNTGVEGCLISVGVLLISCPLLLCICLVWILVVEWFSNIRKSVCYTTASIVAVFATVLILA